MRISRLIIKSWFRCRLTTMLVAALSAGMAIDSFASIDTASRPDASQLTFVPKWLGESPIGTAGKSVGHSGPKWDDGKLPIAFEQNRGQTDAQVRYLARGPGYLLYLTPGEAVLRLRAASTKGNFQPSELPAPTVSPSDESTGRVFRRTAVTGIAEETATLRVSFPGARSDANLAGEMPQKGHSNYFTSGDRSKWRTDVAQYGRVRYTDIYPGIDLLYYGNRQSLEYDFVVAPGADPTNIRFAFRGAQGARLDAGGDLILDMGNSEVAQHKPVVYQEIEGHRVQVAGDYVLDRGNESPTFVGARLALGKYDRAYALIVDPIISYSTYIAGSGVDSVRAMDVGEGGYVYVTGYTSSLDFPIVGGLSSGQGGVPTASTNIFVAKLSPQGDELIYSTYLASNANSATVGLKVDDQGAAYIAGITASTDFPVVGGLPVEQSGVPDGGQSAFVAKLNPAGNALEYSTYLAAGNGLDQTTALAIDAQGSAYVTGFTTPPYSFPVVGGLSPELGGTPAGDGAIFVAKLNPAGSSLVYSTYLSGTEGFAQAAAIAVDGVGEAYVGGGYLTSLTLPRIGGLPPEEGGGAQPEGSQPLYLAKLNAQGNEIIYSTYVRSGAADTNGVAIDASGSLYVAGRTGDDNFPVVGGLPPEQGGQLGADNFVHAFVMKLNPEGNALVYSTLLAGDGFDSPAAVVVDAEGAAYVTGATNSTDFPLVSGLPAEQGGSQSSGPFGPEVCAFVFKLNPSGNALGFSTYLCNNSTGLALAIEQGDGTQVYVAGERNDNGSTFPIVGGLAPDQGGGAFGASEGFVTRLDQEAPLLSLERARYWVDEAGGSVSVEVRRVGALGERISVEFTTMDGTAVAPVDYTSTSGSLSWEANDSESKTIHIPVILDSLLEGDEVFTVTLTSASGATIGSPATATVTIVDAVETDLVFRDGFEWTSPVP